MNDEYREKLGEIIYFLRKEGFVSDEELTYAERIQAKLTTAKPLLDVLKDLDYVQEDHIKKALRANSLSIRIGGLLVDLGCIDNKDLQAALEIQKETSPKQKLGEILISRDFIEEKTLIEVLSLQFGLEYVEPDDTEIDKDLFLKAPVKWYQTHQFIPVKKVGEKSLLAFADPFNKHQVGEAKVVFGENIIPAIATSSSINSAIIQSQQRYRNTSGKIEADDDSVVSIVNSIISQAISQGASDIHIEPRQENLHIRFRQDGVLIHHRNYPLEIAAPLSSRIKIMAEADIAERRRHQGGRILYDHFGRQIDLRVSFYVTIHGEKIVLRILNQSGQLMDISQIGMAPRMLERFVVEAIEAPSGVTLVTGPTGSGKTTTVYSCIKHINNPETSIITAEDPVEIVIDGIAQCSINPKIDLTFHETLKHIVRQDPDVIAIGEIRDNYSAEVAVQAALTGHKVLTTFHTEDSIGGLIRLLNMDIEAFLISSTVVCIVAQRLLRRVCAKCGEPYEPSPREIRRIGYERHHIHGADFKKGRGCSHCRYTGYRGRIAVFELLVLNEAVRDALLQRRPSYDIRKISIEGSGLVTLFEDGILKAVKGLTTIDEVLRCLPYMQQPRNLSEIRRLVGD